MIVLKQKITILTLILIVLAHALPALDVKQGFPKGIETEKLGRTAKKIEYKLDVFKRDGEEYLSAVSDYHAVFDQALGPLTSVIADHDNGEKVFSRMVDTVDLNPEDDLSVPHRQRVHTSAKFLGIGQDYIYDTLVTVEKNTNDEFLMHWTMTSCEVGNFEEYEGFWYLKRLEPVSGCPRTYVRLYAETVFNNIIPFQELIMGLFTEGETIEVFNSVYRAAAGR